MAGNSGLKGLVFDWAGTLFDHGSLGPMGAFVALFARHGVSLSVAQARGPMGLPKWDHIRALGNMPEVADQWQARHGRPLCDADVDDLHTEFTPMNMASVRDHAQLIPGVLPVLQRLRAHGLKLGSTTGYTRPIMEVVLPLAKAQGLVMDSLVCAGDTPSGRPGPVAMYQSFVLLDLWPAHAVVKVDDTVPGLLEGKSAGTWTVAVTTTGNEVGLSSRDWAALSAPAQQQAHDKAALTLAQARPDEIIRSVAELPQALARIEARVARGERPSP